jgi:recombination protein RecT
LDPGLTTKPFSENRSHQAMTNSQLQLPAQVSNLRVDLSRMTKEFESALPSQIPVDRFVRTIVTAVQMQPELLEADRRTLFSACMKAAQDGLLLDGREAGLSIYNDRKNGGKTIAYLPMVGGILKKIRQSGEISSIRAHVVYQGDEFDFELGDNERIHHKPNLTNQGDPVAVYAIAKFKDGDIQREVMSVAQVEKIRAKATGIGKNCWAAEWGEMAKKTVIRRLAKRLPSSNDLDQVLASENASYEPITAVTVTEEAPPQQPETKVSVADLNRQIAAATTQAVAVSVTDSGEETTLEPVELQVESPQTERKDPF